MNGLNKIFCLSFLLFVATACGYFDQQESAAMESGDSLAVVPGPGIEETAPELIGKWRNVGMKASGMYLSAEDISRPDREFTADNYMIISPIGAKADTADFRYEAPYLRAGQEGTERISLLTADSLIIVNELDGEAVSFLFLRVRP